MRRSLLYQIYPVYVIAILLSVGLLTLASARVIRAVFYAEKETELRNSALLIANALGPEVFATDKGSFEPTGRKLSRLTAGFPLRVTIIGADGVVVADTHTNANSAENHSQRPEFLRAREYGTGSDSRHSGTTGENSLYVAVAIHDRDQRFLGVIRSAASVSIIDRRARDAFTTVTLSGLLIIVVTTVLTLIVVRRIHRPLVVIQNAARRYARGDLDYRISLRAPAEIRAIAETLNGMADQLSNTIGSITAQRNELEAILSGMVEGVVVVDKHRRISSINRAAGGLFRVDHQLVKGKSIIEALRNVEIDQLAEKALESDGSREATIVIYDSTVTHVHVHADILNNQGDIGVLLVLNDITRMKRLENIRRDFVANVSHELRTPITSILGFVETLRDGALGDSETAARFTEIIHTHAVRLNLIIEDLLSLSRLESCEADLPLELCAIGPIVTKAIQACEHDAERRSIEIRQDCVGDDPVLVNQALIEQALVNLVHNAVKYSPDAGSVTVTTRIDGGVLLVSVTDHGHGIPRKDLERVFERFYRVDRARSRNMGGTGLGLAIVKHIALAHHGEVTVKSIEGRGSTFTLKIPQP